MYFASLAAAALVGAAQAMDVQVVHVGKNPANNVTDSKFWPENLTAAPGSMVQFQFWAGNHTVTQSSFDNPCTPLEPGAGGTGNGTNAAGIKSGYQPVDVSMPNGEIPTYTVWINDTKPLWFYCAQATHCQGGMALAINADESSGKTLEAYKTAAAALDTGDEGSGGDGGSGSGDSGNGSGDGSGNGDGSEVPSGDADAGTIGDPGSGASGPTLSNMLLLVGAAMALF